jgi:formate hydrogenlyase transcriptional activator
MLARFFTQRFAQRMGRRIDTIPTAVMDALVRYPWPGNIREMQNLLERAVILSPGPALHIPAGDLKVRDQKSEVRGQRSMADDVALTSDFRPPTSGLTLAEAEREHILDGLRAAHWVLRGPSGAAARLGMKRSTLQWKMKKLRIFRPE